MMQALLLKFKEPINWGICLDTFFVRPECRARRGVSKDERKTLGTNGA